MAKLTNKRNLLRLLFMVLPYVLRYFSKKKRGKAPAAAPAQVRSKAPVAEEPADTKRLLGREAEQFDDPIPALFEARQSDTMVTVVGRVVHLLADDNEGSRHQRWLMDTPGRITLKISHNIDLADRVPISEGDLVRVRGEYEWNEKGGVVHWTHHDPKGWHEDGWVEHEGKYYGTA
ncbi:MAG: DUF3465 domain-containing protein [Planctomycetota bacterium]